MTQGEEEIPPEPPVRVAPDGVAVNDPALLVTELAEVAESAKFVLVPTPKAVIVRVAPLATALTGEAAEFSLVANAEARVELVEV